MNKPSPFPFIIVSLLILYLLFCMRSCNSNLAWNDGICTRCGGHYVYVQTVGHQYTTDYMYRCDTCHYQIQIADYHPEAILDDN